MWLCTPGRLLWAWCHVGQHQGCAAGDLAALEVTLPREWVRRWRRGIWLCSSDVLPGQLGRLLTVEEVSRG